MRGVASDMVSELPFSSLCEYAVSVGFKIEFCGKTR